MLVAPSHLESRVPSRPPPRRGGAALAAAAAAAAVAERAPHDGGELSTRVSFFRRACSGGIRILALLGHHDVTFRYAYECTGESALRGPLAGGGHANRQ